MKDLKEFAKIGAIAIGAIIVVRLVIKPWLPASIAAYLP